MSSVLFEKRADGIGLITFNRPERMNALGPGMMELLAEHVAECDADPEVRCVVLTGAGRGFCAGADIKGLDSQERARSDGPPTDPMADFHGRVKQLRQRQDGLGLKLHTMAKPTVAIINGYAIGAGLSFALACDLRLMGSEAKISAGFRNLALSGDMGGTYFLSKLVGNGVCRELIFTGEMLDAPRALALGIVNRVYPQESLMDEALAFCAELAKGPTLAMGMAKENLAVASVASAKEALDYEARTMILGMKSEDHREAVRAFVEKRSPQFKGR